MACNGDDTEPEGKINHWCNVSGEKAWLTLAEGKANARGSIYRLVRRTSQLTHFRARLPVNGKGQPDSAMRLRQFNLCLWIMDIPSEWRPIYVLYHAHPPLPHHLFWLGLWLDSWRFYWWWTSWFIRSSQARPSIRAPCQDRHAECTVTCCLWLTDWLADCAPCLLRHAAHRCDDSQTRGSKTMRAIYAATKLPVSISQLH